MKRHGNQFSGAHARILLLLLIATLAAACGNDSEGGDTSSGNGGGDTSTGSETAGGTDGGGGGADGAGGEDVKVEPPKEDFWVIYSRRSRLPGKNESDLVLTEKDNPQAITNASAYGIGLSPIDGKSKGVELTKYSFKKAGGLTCNFGCVLSDDLKYIAISKEAPSDKGFTYVLGTFNDKLEAFVGKFGELTDVADLHFAGSKLFYSKARNCFQTGKCQYEIRVRYMDGSAEEKVLTVMAPDNDPDILDTTPHTTYTGRFQVSEDGETLVFLTTTIRSVKVWAWRGGNLHQLDYICEHPLDNNTCVGTGSQYHDNDEVGISPDGKSVVLFTIVDRSLRVRKYTIGGSDAPVFSDLVSVPPGGTYLQDICFNLPSWQHAEVRSRPTFSADGKRIFYLGVSQCSGSEEKMWTDLMSIPADKIGKKIEEADYINYTKNPRDNSAENLWIRSFRTSPEKKFFVFAASPTYGSTGDKLPDSDKRQLADTEVYVMPIQAGAEPAQITNETAYATDTPVSIKPVAVTP